MLNVNRIGGEVIRQGQDLIRVIGRVGGVIAASGRERTSCHTELVQVDDSGGLYVKLIRRWLSEAARADQIAVDKIIQIAAGDRDTHGHPLVAVTVIGEIG